MRNVLFIRKGRVLFKMHLMKDASHFSLYKWPQYYPQVGGA